MPGLPEELMAARNGRTVPTEFGRLKHEWAILPLRVRRLTRVRLHADLIILAGLPSVLLATRIP